MGLMPFSIFLATQPGRVWVSPKAQEADCQPLYADARLTNVHSRGFSVYWQTAGNCPASISVASFRWGDDRSVSDSHPQGDPTWVSTTGTHHVTVSLEEHPATGKVQIFLRSGSRDFGNKLSPLEEGGAPIDIFLPEDPSYDPSQPPSPTNTPGAYSTEKGAFSECPTGRLANDCSGANEKVCASDSSLCCHQACYRPYPIWGTIKDSGGQPISGAIVIAKPSPQGEIYPNRLSTVTDEQGHWVVELANTHVISFPNDGFSWDGNEITSEFFAYSTDIDGAGNSRPPGIVKILVYSQKPPLSTLDYLTFPLHSVTDTTPCSSRNTCAKHDCALENPSPICITLGETTDQPRITSFTPESGPIGTEVTIIGENFGDERGQSQIIFIDNVPVTEYLSWANTFTKVKVPIGAVSGPMAIAVPGTETVFAPRSFIVEVDEDRPEISEVRPSFGVRGQEAIVTISGAHLHPDVAFKLMRGDQEILGAIKATPTPSPAAITVGFNIPANASLGSWLLTATKGSYNTRYPFLVVPSNQVTTATLKVMLQGLPARYGPDRQLKVQIQSGTSLDQTHEVPAVSNAQGAYIASLALNEEVPTNELAADFWIWEPGVRLKRKFSHALTPGQWNNLDFTQRNGAPIYLLAGDFNGDNKITLADFTGTQGVLPPFVNSQKVSLPAMGNQPLAKFDVNGDAILNILDISLVLVNFTGLELPGE